MGRNEGIQDLKIRFPNTGFMDRQGLIGQGGLNGDRGLGADLAKARVGRGVVADPQKQRVPRARGFLGNKADGRKWTGDEWVADVEG